VKLIFYFNASKIDLKNNNESHQGKTMKKSIKRPCPRFFKLPHQDPDLQTEAVTNNIISISPKYSKKI
jgi:hypothetical protein